MHRFRWPAGVAVLAIVAAVGILSGGASSSGVVTKAITPSPAWTGAQLSAPAGDNWLEYYGSLTGDRYSSLNQITTANASTLKPPEPPPAPAFRRFTVPATPTPDHYVTI